MAIVEAISAAHALPVAEVARSLSVDPGRGLSAEEAAARLTRGGPNELEPPRRTSLVASVLDAATEPFVVLLAVAGLLALFLGEVRDGILVLIGLVPIVGADVITEHRAERALERQGEAPRVAARHARVVGRVAALDVHAVIPGHGEPFADVGAALERAFARTAAFEADSLRVARHALKAVLTFALLDQRRLPLCDMPAYVDRIGIYRDFNARFFRLSPSELAERLAGLLAGSAYIAPMIVWDLPALRRGRDRSTS